MIGIFEPILNDHGAIRFYPILLVNIAILLIPVYFISNELLTNKDKQKTISYFKVFVASSIPFFAITTLNQHLNLFSPPMSAKKVSSYPTAPNSGSIKVINRLNLEANSNDIVITNYSDLNRYYSFLTFSNVTPFMSSKAYFGITHKKDLVLREKILNALFETGNLDYFSAELKKHYPNVKFLFIDNSIAFQKNAPAELYMAYGDTSKTSTMFCELPNEVSLDKNIRKLGKNFLTRSYENDFKLIIADITPTITAGINKGILTLVYRNEEASLYKIN